MIWGVLAGLGVAWWIGRCIVKTCLPTSGGGHTQTLLCECLALGVGVGLTSIFLLFSMLLLGKLDWTMLLAEVLIAVALFFVARHKRAFTKAATTQRAPFSRREKVWLLLFGIALLAMLISHACLALKSPHGGGFDSFIIWNLRARFLFRGGVDWLRGFSEVIAWSHPDYPLLVPATVARLWAYTGRETAAGPCLFASLMTLATVGLLVAALTRIRGREQGLLGGIALLATPFFVTHGASQYAEVPLSFFILAVLVLIVWHERDGVDADGRLLVLAGLLAGFAAWTKNEGIVFAVAATVALFSSTRARAGGKPAVRHTLLLLCGLLPVLLWVALCKVFIAPPNDLVAGQSGAATLARLADFSRYWKVLCWFGERVILFDHKGVVHIVPVLAVYFLLAGVSQHQTGRALRTLLLALVMVAVAYGMVYVCTPHDLEWHLMTSLDRLLLQLWPASLFLFFLVVRSPGELLASGECRR